MAGTGDPASFKVETFHMKQITVYSFLHVKYHYLPQLLTTKLNKLSVLLKSYAMPTTTNTCAVTAPCRRAPKHCRRGTHTPSPAASWCTRWGTPCGETSTTKCGMTWSGWYTGPEQPPQGRGRMERCGVVRLAAATDFLLDTLSHGGPTVGGQLMGQGFWDHFWAKKGVQKSPPRRASARPICFPAAQRAARQ